MVRQFTCLEVVQVSSTKVLAQPLSRLESILEIWLSESVGFRTKQDDGFIMNLCLGGVQLGLGVHRLGWCEERREDCVC